MNLLFIHHDPKILTEISESMYNQHFSCFYARNTDETIRILDEQHIDLAVLIITHMRVAAVLKHISDNYKDQEVLLMASEEYDEIISLFCDSQYKIVRIPKKLTELMDYINMTSYGQEEMKPHRAAS